MLTDSIGLGRSRVTMNSLLEISTLVDGTLIGVSRNVAEKLIISNALPLNQAIAGSITLVDKVTNAAVLKNSQAAAVIVNEAHVDAILNTCKDVPLILLAVANPHDAFERTIELVRPTNNKLPTGIDARAAIGENVYIGRDVTIGPFVTIGANCSIGDRTVLHSGARVMSDCNIGRDCEVFPNAVLYPRTTLEDRVTVHSGAVIGAYGFGYRQSEGRHNRTAQLGWVHVASDVEIGANTTIDRGSYGATKIGVGTKLDNLVQIGHNVDIGPHNLICSQVGIAGSASTGSHVVLAGQVGVRDHIHIGERTQVGAQSGVATELPGDGIFVGSPAAPHKESLQSLLAIQRLPEMRKQLRKLQSEMDRLLKSQSNEDATIPLPGVTDSKAA